MKYIRKSDKISSIWYFTQSGNTISFHPMSHSTSFWQACLCQRKRIEDWIWLVPVHVLGTPCFTYLVAWGLEIIIVRRIFCPACLLLCAPSLIWSPSIHGTILLIPLSWSMHLRWPKPSNDCSYHDACVLVRCIISQWSLVRLDIS